MTTEAKGKLLRDARAISAHLFDDAAKFKSVYALTGELPIFHLLGQICAYSGSLDRAMTAKVEAAATQRPAKTRKARASI